MPFSNSQSVLFLASNMNLDPKINILMHEYDYLLSHHTTIFYVSSKQEQSATKFTLPAISAAPPQMSNRQPCLTSIYSRSVVAVVPPAGAAWLAAAAPVPPAPWVSMPLQHVRPVPQPCPLNHSPPRPQVEQSWPATRGDRKSTRLNSSHV